METVLNDPAGVLVAIMCLAMTTFMVTLIAIQAGRIRELEEENGRLRKRRQTTPSDGLPGIEELVREAERFYHEATGHIR